MPPIQPAELPQEANPVAGGSYVRLENGELQQTEATQPSLIQPATLPMSREEAQKLAAAMESDGAVRAFNTPSELE